MAKMFHFIYYLKQLILLTPFSYGYHRHLRKFKDPNFNFERDKHPIREKHYGDSGWKSKKEGNLQYREYSSYEEYLIHQAEKFNEIVKLLGGISNQGIRAYRSRFYRRFHYIQRILPKSAKILCLGARDGTEVEVLRDLGFKHAMGIDLNPGPDNPLVKKGDFMALEYADNSLDMIYSNCLDHAFDLDKFFQEHARVLRPGGFALYDVAVQGQAGGASFEAVKWESDEGVILLILKHFQKLLKVETEADWKWLLVQKWAA